MIALAAIKLSAPRVLSSPPLLVGLTEIPDRRLPAIESRYPTLRQAADALARVSGIAIEIDSPAEERADEQVAGGFYAPFSWHTTGDVTLDRALAALTEQRGIAYYTDGPLIRITITENQPRIMRVYDVRDLRDRFMHELKPNSSPNDGPLIPKWLQQDPEHEATMCVAQVICDAVHREHWVANGGTLSDMKASHGKLIVFDTPAGHRKIIRVLAGWRKLYDHPWSNRVAGGG